MTTVIYKKQTKDTTTMSERITSHEHTENKPLSQSEIEESLDAPSLDERNIIAGARIETMLLDLEENPAKAGEGFAERKSEIESALEIVNTTKPDDEKGLSSRNVIDERIEIMKNAIKNDPNNAKLWESRLVALELASDVISEVAAEPTDTLKAKTSGLHERDDQKKADELYQEHELKINGDIRASHNSRVRENDKRRKLLEQIKLHQSITTRQ